MGGRRGNPRERKMKRRVASLNKRRLNEGNRKHIRKGRYGF